MSTKGLILAKGMISVLQLFLIEDYNRLEGSYDTKLWVGHTRFLGNGLAWCGAVVTLAWPCSVNSGKHFTWF